MKTVGIVRERGQLTIPDSIRKIAEWISPLSAVSISIVKPDEIIIRPHKKQYDWDKIWKMVKRSRSFKGRGRGSASEFIAKDRLSY